MVNWSWRNDHFSLNVAAFLVMTDKETLPSLIFFYGIYYSKNLCLVFNCISSVFIILYRVIIIVDLIQCTTRNILLKSLLRSGVIRAYNCKMMPHYHRGQVGNKKDLLFNIHEAASAIFVISPNGC